MSTPGFIFGGDTGISYEDLQNRRKMAERLRSQNSRTPRNVGEGIHSIARALVAKGVDKQNTRRAGELRDEYGKMWSSITGALGGNTGGSSYSAAPRDPAVEMGLDMGSAEPAPRETTPVPAGMNMPAGELDMGRNDMTKYRDAIASIESAGSGDYAAVGPTHPKLGRALGRYQVMEANIPQWSREALGREITPEEFLANPDLQDAIFDHKFGGYVEQFGDKGAAQAWFAGPGGVGKMNRQDSLGTSVADYTQKFTGALGSPQRGGAGAGVRTAQAGGIDPSIMQMAQLLSAPDEFMPPGQKAVVQALLERKLAESQPQKPNFSFIKGVGMVDMNNPPRDLMAGQYEVPASETQTEYGLTPQYATNADGELTMVVIGKDGTSKEVKMPEGLALEKGLEKLDLGTSYQWVNTITGEQIGQPIKKDLRGAAEETAKGSALGKAGAESEIRAPQLVAQANEAITLIDDVLNDPALDSVLGKYQGRLEPDGMTGLIMSQEQLDLVPKIKQLSGKAFLEAFEKLKGGGQITEREGQAALDASARLQRYQSEEAFTQALTEIRNAVLRGKLRAQGIDVPEMADPRQFVDGGPATAAPKQTFEQFSQDPSAKAAAEKYGVTLEEMWEIKQQGAQ